MNRYNSSVSGTQIVQAYAAKRAAQLEHARLLKVERDKKKGNDDALSEQPVNAYTTQSTERSLSRDPTTSNPITRTVKPSPQTPKPSPQPVSSSFTQPRSSSASVLVGEADLYRAVQAGIITMDQCRKLWDTFQQAGTPADDTPKESVATPSSSRYRMQPSQPATSAQQPASPMQAQPDSLNDPARMQAQVVEAQMRDQDDGGWNMSTTVAYDDLDDDDTFVKKNFSSRKNSIQKAKEPRHQADTPWQVDAEPVSQGFGEPPKIPTRKTPAKKAAVRTAASSRTKGARSSSTVQPSHGGGYSAGGDNGYSSRLESSGPVESSGYRVEASGFGGIPTTTVDLDNLPTNAVQSSSFEAEAMDAASEAQYPCSKCGRSFREAILKRHTQNCGKQKQRKQFDASKARELPEQNMVQKTRETPQASKKSTWKQHHEQFQAAMKNNKLVRQVESGALPASALAAAPPPPDNRVPCPHCTRKFAAEVAERHIPKCKNILAKPKSLRRY